MKQVTATFASVRVTQYAGHAARRGAPPDASPGVAGVDGGLPGARCRRVVGQRHRHAPAGVGPFQDGRFLLAGGGRDIWARADNGVFVYQRLAGDAEITARIPGVEATNTHAKAGLMIRASLLADDVNTMWLVKPIDPAEGGTCRACPSSGGPARAQNSTARNQRFFLPPQTLRLARKGRQRRGVDPAGPTTSGSWSPPGAGPARGRLRRPGRDLPRSEPGGHRPVRRRHGNRPARPPLPDGGADAPFNDAALPDAAPDTGVPDAPATGPDTGALEARAAPGGSRRPVAAAWRAAQGRRTVTPRVRAGRSNRPAGGPHFPGPPERCSSSPPARTGVS